MAKRKKKAVCLFSGGLDSTTVLYHALDAGYQVYALSFDYGQRHKRELGSAKKIAKKLKLEHHIVSIQLPWGGSALTDKKIRLPKKKKIVIGKKIPVTYVPGRNIIFLSFGFSWAEVVGASAVFIGANQLDYSGYPDCRGPFLKSFERMATIGMKGGVTGKKITVQAPLLHKTKKQIIEKALALEVPLKLTWSCYEGGKRPCGKCDSCLLRKKGFQELKLNWRDYH